MALQLQTCMTPSVWAGAATRLHEAFHPTGADLCCCPGAVARKLHIFCTGPITPGLATFILEGGGGSPGITMAGEQHCLQLPALRLPVDSRHPGIHALCRTKGCAVPAASPLSS